MRLALIATLVAASALSACATPGAVGIPNASLVAPSADPVKVLQEVNRHLETCDRTYAWPFAATITCHAVVPPPVAPAQPVTADAIGDAIARAFAAERTTQTAPH